MIWARSYKSILKVFEDNVMDYTYLVSELNNATTFDLYRLHVAISNELENPRRILNIKQKLRIGMELSYFCHIENRLINAKLFEMRQKNVVVLDHEKNKRFVIPYYMLNVDGIDAQIYESKNTEILTPNTLKVGDCVGFSKEGESIVGIIKRINHKTVTLETNSGHQWRVAYSFLYRVYDAEKVTHTLPIHAHPNIHDCNNDK